MSRTLMAAARKHQTPNEFVKKFLLPAFGSGRIPNAYRQRTTTTTQREITIAPLIPTRQKLSRTIVFSNENDPSKTILIRIMEAQFPNGQKKQYLGIGHNPNTGPKITESDYRQGKKLGWYDKKQYGVIKIEYLDIPEKVLKHWKTTAGNYETREPFPIHDELFQRLRNLQKCSNGIDKMMIAIRVLSGISPPRALENTMQRVYFEQGLSLIQLYLKIENKNNFFEKVLNATDEKTIETAIAETYHVPKRFARLMAAEVVINLKRRNITFGIHDFLEEIRQFRHHRPR